VTLPACPALDEAAELRVDVLQESIWRCHEEPPRSQLTGTRSPVPVAREAVAREGRPSVPLDSSRQSAKARNLCRRADCECEAREKDEPFGRHSMLVLREVPKRRAPKARSLASPQSRDLSRQSPPASAFAKSAREAGVAPNCFQPGAKLAAEAGLVLQLRAATAAVRCSGA
jgi:hypothetical protein